MRTHSITRHSYFVFTGEEGRVRRPRDVVTAVTGILLVLWAVLAADRIPPWAQSLTELVASAPEWVTALLRGGYLLSLVYALVVTGGLILGGPSRRRALRDMLVALVGVSALVVVLSLLVNEAWPYILPEIGLDNPVPRFPVTRVSIVTAILLVAAPYVARPLRRFGWLAIFTTAVASVGLGYASPIQAMGSFGLGLFVAGLLLVAVGTPKGYPSPESVASGLALLGVPNSSIRASSRQRWGLVRFEAEDEQGRSLDIKVHGRDSFDSQLAAKIWRTLTYKEIGRTVSYSRLQAVEHEALVTLMAARAGVPVPDLAAVGNASAEIALVAFVGMGSRLDELGHDEIDDELLIRVWQRVGKMHDANISHGGLRAEAVGVDEDTVRFLDFGLGSLAPGVDDKAGDVVELLFSISLLVGPERAARTAYEGLGPEGLVEALPYLQVPAVSATSRRKADKAKDVVEALNETILDLTDAEKPEPVEIRRVTLRSILMGALVLLVISALLPLFTEVDYAEIWDVLESADWALIVIAVIVGHTQFFPQATATMFAVPATLPFWPLITLQTASQFISLAIPSAAGRVAMNSAFLHNFGVSITVAVTQGAIDSFSGFLVQAALLLAIWLTGGVDLGFDVDASDIPWLLILGILALLAIGTVLAITRIEKLRIRVVPVVTQAWGALKVVLQTPSRAIGLLGSNFVYWNVLGLTLWVLLEAVGVDISYGSALFVAAGTNLFAGFMPVPGGVGVAEAAMVALLATFGVDQSTAFAVTAGYRVITFYLPALEGFFGTRWLERNDYI
ncbi:MAG: flippase-like domain-containing protein [Acidimicrobiia bacterium]